jgi:hypothetical protein
MAGMAVVQVLDLAADLASEQRRRMQAEADLVMACRWLLHVEMLVVTARQLVSAIETGSMNPTSASEARFKAAFDAFRSVLKAAEEEDHPPRAAGAVPTTSRTR